MKRNPDALVDHEYDVIIIGGGINGVACAWDAALRGLHVALLERDDFGSATSSNSAKIAHSGLRYLQHLDFARMRESIGERNSLVARAPHLVESQPFVLPIYGHGIKGREVMAAYLKVFDLLSLERKRFRDPARRIPDSRIISRDEAVKRLPGVDTNGLTAAAVWHEGQIHNTERLLISTLRAAAEHGTDCANYVEVGRILTDGDRVIGVEVTDRPSGDSFVVRGKSIINATGPWLDKTLDLTSRPFSNRSVHGSKAFSLLTRPLSETHAISFGIRPMYLDKQAVINKGTSIQFAIPWRGSSLIGSLHLSCSDDPDKVSISEEEISIYIERINEGCPAAKLHREDVKRVLWGMVPADEAGSAAPKKHHAIVDHADRDRLQGLISIAGVKLTTSRHVAEKAVDLVYEKLGYSGKQSSTRDTPLWGGDIEFLDEFMRHSKAALSDLAEDVALRLLRTYGSEHRRVLACASGDAGLRSTLTGTSVMKAEVVHAVREEMALTLEDVMLRRTDLGSLEFPGNGALVECAQVMAGELGWDSRRMTDETEHVRQLYEPGRDLSIRTARQFTN
jgi:glycerol-3-phosphate dehydrogenase